MHTHTYKTFRIPIFKVISFGPIALSLFLIGTHQAVHAVLFFFDKFCFSLDLQHKPMKHEIYT